MGTGLATQVAREALRWNARGPMGMALLAGKDFDCVYANGAFARLARRGGVTGRPFFDLFPELAGQGARAVFDGVAARRRPWRVRGKRIALGRSGALAWDRLDISLQPLVGPAGEWLGLFLQCGRTCERGAHDAAGADGCDRLTGLADYDTFRAVLAQALSAGRGVQVVALDVNRFYRVNACIGHDGGDRILRALGARLGDAAGAGVPVARAGANRLLFLFDAKDERSAEAPARLMAVFSQPFLDSGLELYLSASIAVARFPEHGASVGQLMASLDHAMAEARRAGAGLVREGVRIDAREREQACLAVALRNAIDAGAIDVHYQPQVDLDSGAICGVEALVRWTDPAAGPISADRIIQMAEEAGLIGRLGERVLRTACAQAQAWREMGFRDLRVAVNLSARQVCMRSLERMVLAVLAQTGLPPSNLDLELTESVVMDDIGRAAACFENLKRHGVRLSLDDFGTGYSSLAYLRLFPIDALKLDRLFLDLVPDNARAAGLVGAIIAAAHGLGMRVVAEGVEHEAQLRFLAREGCDEIQGYFFSKPMAPEQVTSMLKERKTLPVALRRRKAHAPTILLVDGDRERGCALGALAAHLLDHGGRIVYAGSGAEAVRMTGDTPDLILVGPGVPDMPAPVFLRMVRQLCPAAARVLLLGEESGQDEPAMEPGLADAIISWPAGRAGLLEQMRAILR